MTREKRFGDQDEEVEFPDLEDDLCAKPRARAQKLRLRCSTETSLHFKVASWCIQQHRQLRDQLIPNDFDSRNPSLVSFNQRLQTIGFTNRFRVGLRGRLSTATIRDQVLNEDL